MVKKIVHVADLHNRLLNRHAEYRKVYDRFFEEMRALAPDRIVIAGDLVHSKNTMSPELISLLCYFLTGCAAICKVIVIPGNHDFLLNNHDRLDAISPILEMINNPNIVYYKQSGCYEDDNVVWCTYSLYEKNKRPAVEEARKAAGRKKRHYIGIYHGEIDGLRTDLGYKFENSYDAGNFEGLDYVLCGDIHKRQHITYDKTNIYMVGSMIQQDYGETVKGHGYGVLDLQKGEYAFEDLENDHGYYTFRVRNIEDIINGAEELLNLC